MNISEFLCKYEPAIPFTKKEKFAIQELFRPLLYIDMLNFTPMLLKIMVFNGENYNKKNIVLAKKLFSKLRKEGILPKTYKIMSYIPAPSNDTTTMCTNDDLNALLKYLQKCKFVAKRRLKGQLRAAIIHDTITALALTAGLGQSHYDILKMKVKDINMDECTVMLHGQEFSFDLIAEFLHPVLMDIFEEAAENTNKEAFLVYNHITTLKQRIHSLLIKTRGALQKLSIDNCVSIKDFRQLYVYNMIHLPIYQLEEIMGRDSKPFLQKDAAYNKAKYEYIELQKRNKTMGMRMPVKTLELPCC